MSGRSRCGRFAIVPARAVDDERLSPAALRVLTALSTYADRDGWCWPSASTVAQRLGISRQAVARQERMLVQLGYLEVQRRYRPNGSERTGLRRLLYDGDLPPEADRLGEQPDVAPEGQPDVAGGATPDVAGGATPDVAGGATPDVAPTRTPHKERPTKNGGAPSRSHKKTGQLANSGDLSRFEGIGGGGGR